MLIFLKIQYSREPSIVSQVRTICWHAIEIEKSFRVGGILGWGVENNGVQRMIPTLKPYFMGGWMVACALIKTAKST
jgi:hypothetical protein